MAFSRFLPFLCSTGNKMMRKYKSQSLRSHEESVGYLFVDMNRFNGFYWTCKIIKLISIHKLLKVRGPFVQTLCIEKDSYMDAI